MKKDIIINEDTDQFSIEDFIKACKDGYFTDNDGSGYLVLDGKELKNEISIRDLLKGDYDKKATHINWFNK